MIEMFQQKKTEEKGLRIRLSWRNLKKRVSLSFKQHGSHGVPVMC